MDIFNPDYIGLDIASPDNPPAGTNLLWMFPSYTRIQIISVRLTITTDANVGDRFLVVAASDGTTIYAASPAPGEHEASEALEYTFAPCSLGVDQSANFSFQNGSLSGEMFLNPHNHLITDFKNIQVGDQISAVTIRYKQRLPR